MSKIDLASGESSLLELSRAPKIFEAKASEIDLAGVQTDFLRPFGSKRPEVERQIRPNGSLHVAHQADGPAVVALTGSVLR